MIEISEAVKEYGDLTAVNQVTLAIGKGTFFGLLGPNGAGKTTLIRLLTGLSKPRSGQVRINNMKVSRDNKDLKRIIGIVPQHTNLDKELTVRENLVFCARLFGLNKKDRMEKIEELLEITDLKDASHKQAKILSGGMKRKLMIAKALIHEPRVLFLDEPTIGVDVNQRKKIWDILKSMKHSGKTIMMTTHYIEEADYLCDETALMHEGKIFYRDSPEKLKERLGRYAVEFFNPDCQTEFRFFRDLKTAKEYAACLQSSFTIRDTTLEDVFFQFTNKKVL